MSTDNTTPRLTKELMGVAMRLEVIIPRIPIVVGRLDAEQGIGFPTGHTGSGMAQDGPDRWQTSDPAYCATKALLDAHRRLTQAAVELDQLTGNWMRRKPNARDASRHETEGQCVSCIRVGQPSLNSPDTGGRGGLCAWCYRTLIELNKIRKAQGYGPALNEVPYQAVWDKWCSGRLRMNTGDQDRWARNLPDKPKRQK